MALLATEGIKLAWRLPDSRDLVIWPSLEPHLTNFVVTQAHLSCLCPLAVDFLGLRRNEASA